MDFAKLFMKENPNGKLVEAVNGMNHRWLLNLTKAKKNNQMKILNS